jgi:hypothetical protein
MAQTVPCWYGSYHDEGAQNGVWALSRAGTYVEIKLLQRHRSTRLQAYQATSKAYAVTQYSNLAKSFLVNVPFTVVEFGLNSSSNGLLILYFVKNGDDIYSLHSNNVVLRFTYLGMSRRNIGDIHLNTEPDYIYDYVHYHKVSYFNFTSDDQWWTSPITVITSDVISASDTVWLPITYAEYVTDPSVFSSLQSVEGVALLPTSEISDGSIVAPSTSSAYDTLTTSETLSFIGIPVLTVIPQMSSPSASASLSEDTGSPPSKAKNNIAAGIIGGVTGAVIFLVLLPLLWLRKRRLRRRNRKRHHHPKIPELDPAQEVKEADSTEKDYRHELEGQEITECPASDMAQTNGQNPGADAADTQRKVVEQDKVTSGLSGQRSTVRILKRMSGASLFEVPGNATGWYGP